MIYGYFRVSTDRQADEGQSLGTQQRIIQGYAMQQGWTGLRLGAADRTPAGLVLAGQTQSR